MTKNRALLATSAASAALLWGASGPALADCAPDPVASGGTVTCTGTDLDGFFTFNDNVTVDVASTATVVDRIGLIGANPRVDNAGMVGAGARFGVFGGVSGTMTVVNTGRIEGSSSGLSVFNLGAPAALNVVNSGTIEGENIFNGAIALSGQLAVRVENTGTIRSTRSVGLVHFGSAGSLTVVNSGTISGAQAGEFGTILGFGDILLDITNAGLIEHRDGGPAIEAAFNTDDRLELQPGSVITGDVLASNGTDTLAFGGTGTMAFDISSVDGDNTDDGEQYLDFETFVKEDDSTLTLTGTNAEIAAFTVTGGLLNLNGALPNATLDVDGGALGGVGTVGVLDVNPGAILAPGNSIGTLNVGSATLAAGSTYAVELAADGTSDLLAATGQVTLQGGQVNPIDLSPAAAYAPQQRYTIVTAAGGVSGTFASVIDNAVLVDYALSYDANNAFLTRTVVAPFTAGATTFNTRQVAGALAGFDFTSDPSVLASLLPLSAASLDAALNALTGEVHAEAPAAAASTAGAFGELLTALAARDGAMAGVAVAPLAGPGSGAAAFAPDGSADVEIAARHDADLDAAPPAPLGPTVWLGGFGGYADLEADGNAGGYDLATYGLALGLQGDYGSATYGLGIGYSHADLDLARPQDGDIDTFHLGLYGSLGAGRLEQGLAARGALTYAHHRIDTRRRIAVGAIDRTATADYSGNTLNADLEARYNLAFDTATLGPVVVSPFLRGQFGRTDLGSFIERGAGALNLSGSATDFEASSVALGLSLSGDYDLGSVVWRPTVSVAYERLTGDDNGAASLTLGGSPTAFAARGADEGRNRLRFGSVSRFVLSRRATFLIATDSVLSQDRQDISAKAAFKLTF